MARSGEELGADLWELWLAGERRLPALAEEVYAAAAAVAASADGDDAFWRPAELSGPYGVARGPWAALRDEVSGMLRETADSLELTGEALSLAAREYARTDDAARAKLEELQARNADLTAPR